MELGQDEKKFLRLATKRHIDEVKKNEISGEQMADFATSEAYIKFLERIIKKLK